MTYDNYEARREVTAAGVSGSRYPPGHATDVLDRSHPHPMDRPPIEEPIGQHEITIRAEGNTLFVEGDIDLYQAATFRQRAGAHIRDAGDEPRLDLTAVAFLDSAGLAALLALSREAQAQGKTLRLAVKGGPRRVLKITGIDRMLTIEE